MLIGPFPIIFLELAFFELSFLELSFLDIYYLDISFLDISFLDISFFDISFFDNFCYEVSLDLDLDLVPWVWFLGDAPGLGDFCFNSDSLDS